MWGSGRKGRGFVTFPDVRRLPDALLELDRRARGSLADSLEASLEFPHDDRLARCIDLVRDIATVLAHEVARRLCVETTEFLNGGSS
jgi:hypothetical protein